MAQEPDTVKVTPPSGEPEPAQPAPPVSPDIARPNALFTLSSGANSIAAVGNALRSAKTTSDAWSDEYWTASGYEKAAVTQALDRLIAASDTFATDNSADIEVLRNQA